jgi:hypothetical protein
MGLLFMLDALEVVGDDLSLANIPLIFGNLFNLSG